VKSSSAGPTLRAIVAAHARARLARDGALFEDLRADRRRSGTRREELNGLVLTATNALAVRAGEVESRLTWDVAHPAWSLRLVERARMAEDGTFEKVAPYEVHLQGDLVDAARFLGLAREIFFDALRADGWTAAEATVERLRWLDTPYVPDGGGRNLVQRLL